jgi:hypothetical protein
VKITDDGKVKLRLKTAWRDGTSHLLLSPHEFLEKLAAIIPPPKSHLVRWGGVFAANSPFREKIILKPEEKKGFDFQNREKKRVNKSWSLVLARVFKLDVLKCDCGGDLTPLGAVQDPVEVKRYLKHLKIDYDPPPRGPPRQMQGSFGFGQQYVSDGTEPDFYPD